MLYFCQSSTNGLVARRGVRRKEGPSRRGGQHSVHPRSCFVRMGWGDAGREIREQMFSEVKHLLHDLDAGLLPISVFFPYLPIPKHRARDR